MTYMEDEAADDVLDILIKARRALKMQEGAEIWNSNCVECEGSGDWAECSICTDAFGKAIDARNSVMPLIDTALARHRTTSLAAQDGLVERIAEALLSAFLAGRGSITARERRAYKPEPDMSHFRAIALASIEVKS